MPKSTELAQKLSLAALKQSKAYKTCWIELGQTLYSIWDSQIYNQFGYDKFNDYVEKELGIEKSDAMRLIKNYHFIEEQETQLIKAVKDSDVESNDIPSIKTINVLRKARLSKDLLRDDYAKIRKSAIEEKKSSAVVAKELTSLIRERKHVDPEQEREDRRIKAWKKAIKVIKEFKRDLENLKLDKFNVIEETGQFVMFLENNFN